MSSSLRLSKVLLSTLFTFAALASASFALAVDNPATNAATAITTSNATLNAVNGDTAATGSSFWASAVSFVPAIPNFIPGTTFTTPDLGAVGALTPFSAQLSATGIPVNPNTTYYYSAWSYVGATWLPGPVQTVTTLGLSQTIVFTDPADSTYGDAPLALVATGGLSGNPVTFATSSLATICTVSGATVTITGAGTCVVTADQAGGGSYSAAPQVTQSFIIAPKVLSISAAVANKVYDGTTTATLVAAPTITGLVSPDTMTLSPAFADKIVATGKPITFTLGGTAVPANYTYTLPVVTADITVKNLSIVTNDIAAATKVYDGATTATPAALPVWTFDALQGTDTVATVTLVPGTATLAAKHVGAQTVTFSGFTLGGVDAPNYALQNQPISESQTISALPITVTAVAGSKVYDGTVTSSAIPTLSTPLVGGDTGVFGQVYDNKNTAGSPTKTMIPTAAVITDGNIVPGSNYAITYTSANVGSITPAPLTVSGAVVTPKVYDKTTPATIDITGATAVGVISPDVVVLTGGTGTYDNSNAGVGKTVTVVGITTADTNYTVTQPTLTGVISPRPLTVTATFNSKVYDGNLTAAAIPTITVGALQGTDTAVLTEAYATKVVGSANKVVIPTATITDGNVGANYTVTLVNDTVSTITPATLTVTATGMNKVYDATTAATVTLSDDRVLGDVLTATYAGATFNNKNVGVAKPVSVTGIAISGTDAPNYVLALTTASTTADITPKNLTIVPTTPGKVYDATTGATVTYTDNRLAGDIIGITGSAAFNDKTAGVAKLVVLAPVTLFGADAGNYTVVGPTTTNATITPAPLTASFTASNKVYDGLAAATIVTRSVVTTLATDVVTITGGTATFANKNVGTGKTVTASGFVLGGADGANYAITTTNTTTADITTKPITVTATGINKVYDGTTSATVTYADDRVPGDSLAASGTPAFADKHVGVAKPVTVTAIAIAGTDATNYSLTATTAATVADITPHLITVTASPNTKVYDATTASLALPTITVGAIQTGDSAVLAQTYDNKNVAGSPAKVLTPTIVITDGNIVPGANYAVTYVNNATGVITVAPLTVSFTASNKVYDQTATATIATRTVTVILGTDDVSAAGGTATFANKNVGVGKTVTGTGFTLAGADALNYAITTTNTTTANITTKPLVITVTGIDKVYDATTAATVTYGDDRIVGDVLTTLGTATFADKNVGAGKVVSVSGITTAGADALNYTANTTASTTAAITARPLLVSATASKKVFDGNTNATVALTDDRVVGDIFTVNYTGANFDTAAAGTGKTVTVAGITLVGADAGNYTPNVTALTTADIESASNGPVYGGGGNGSGYIGGTSFGGSSSSASIPSSTNPFAVNTTGVPTAPTVLAQGGNSRGIVAGASAFKFEKNMRIGSRISPDVSELQKVLISAGYLKLTAPTGVFGGMTFAAVMQYQSAQGVPATGYVGPLTRAKLNAGL
ncbi:MAG: YDG domain-containing protein [Minisyncoccia bacterium]